MSMHQQDSDFVHWFLRGDPFDHTAYSSDMLQHDGNMYQTHYYRDRIDAQRSQIENDEAYARTLQEEFSQLTVAEASDFTHVGEEQLKISSKLHEWRTPSTRDYYYSAYPGYEYGQDESDDLVPCSSCSSPSDSEDFSGSLELTEGYLLDDDEVGKRLHPMIPIPEWRVGRSCYIAGSHGLVWRENFRNNFF